MSKYVTKQEVVNLRLGVAKLRNNKLKSSKFFRAEY